MAEPIKIVEYGELLQGIEIRKTDVVLDLGCGAGPQDLLLARQAARVVGVDVSTAQIGRARALAATYAGAHNIEYLCTPSKQPVSNGINSTRSSASLCWSTSPIAVKCWASCRKS